MSKLEQLQKHALECLRLEADCMRLAADGRSPHFQSHFVRMARVWSALAISGPGANDSPELAEGNTQTT
jgi:hypothetical protein